MAAPGTPRRRGIKEAFPARRTPLDLGPSFLIAALPAFAASAVEFVEAATIVLAVGVTRGWRAPLAGAAAAAAALAVIVALLGATLVQVVPEHALKAVVGALLLLFGLRWLRKATLRFAGIVALHDEELIYQRELATLRAQGRGPERFDTIGALIAFKAVLLEGTEVAFIVIAFGAGGGTGLAAAVAGAAAAGVLVVLLAVALRQPLTMVPENWLKFGVGAMLSSFGVFWFAEGLGNVWPGDALSILLILAAFLAASRVAVALLHRILPEGAEVAGTRV